MNNKNIRQEKFNFTLSTYNILAPSLAYEHKYLYSNVDSNYLCWNYRKKKIIDEIRQFNSDIYCFQEMQEDQYYEFFFPRFKRLGYYCLYKKRIGDKPDGCSIIFKRSKFELVSHEYLEYFVPNVDTLNRENIAIVAMLKPRSGCAKDERLCVATTHLLYSPKRGDVKLAQMQMLLAHLDKIAFKELILTPEGPVNKYHPLIICGDFNSCVNSNIYQFIVNSRLDNYASLNRSAVSGQLKSLRPSDTKLSSPLIPSHVNISDQSQFVMECERRRANDEVQLQCTFGGDSLSHSFSFKSAYEHIGRDGCEEVTSCLPSSHDNVDYIFYNCNEHLISLNECSLQLVSSLELFTKKQLENVYLPNKHFPSDHFMLSAEFALCKLKASNLTNKL